MSSSVTQNTDLPYSYCTSCRMRTTPGTVIRGMKCKCGGKLTVVQSAAQDARGNK